MFGHENPLGIWMGIYIYIWGELGKYLKPRSYPIILGFINIPPPPHLAHINF